METLTNLGQWVILIAFLISIILMVRQIIKMLKTAGVFDFSKKKVFKDGRKKPEFLEEEDKVRIIYNGKYMDVTVIQNMAPLCELLVFEPLTETVFEISYNNIVKIY